MTRPHWLAPGLMLVLAHGTLATTITVTLNTDTSSGGAAGSGPGVSGDLRHAINNSIANDTILFNCGSPCVITLGGPLPPISHNLTVDGGSLGNVILDGAGSFRVFFVDTGSVAIRNLQIQNARAQGGHGGSPGGGGGGLGAGAGLFVNQAGAAVTVTNCSFVNTVAVGGAGNSGTSGGGGGGLNFAGGGWSGVVPSSTANAGGGGGGFLSAGNASGSGNSAAGGTGGNGGGGGGGGAFAAGAGGSAGAAFTLNAAAGPGATGNGTNGGNGGAGGFGGGGGGAGDCSTTVPTAVGGAGGIGGFGGGGGGGGICYFVSGQLGGNGGAGGPGGGGGAGGTGFFANNGNGGAGGLLTAAVHGGVGGDGGAGGGGGGAAAGPAIFVRLGTLSISGSTATGASATGGPGSSIHGLSGTADSMPVFNYAGTVNGSATVGPVPGAVTNIGLRFVPITPCRVADTRNANGAFGGPQITGGTARDFIVPNSGCGAPSTALAYSLNVAVVPGGPLGFLTVWPTGQSQPVASTVNSLDGRVKSNAAIVPAGTGGAISVFASNSTNVVLDINGYFVSATVPTALAFFPVAPCRVADTRNAAGQLGGPSLSAGQTRAFPILSTSTCSIPATAQAYSFNFAAVPKGPLGFITAWPTGQGQPGASSLNAPTGTVTANAVIVPAGTSGMINVFASNATDLVIDINGYFAPMTTGGLSLYNVTPCRTLDTRQPSGAAPFNGKLDVATADSVCGVPAAAQAHVLGATVAPPGALGFLTLWPQGQTQPTVSTLNALDAAVTSNLAIVPTTNGSISAFASNPTHLVLDIFGYFAQ